MVLQIYLSVLAGHAQVQLFSLNVFGHGCFVDECKRVSVGFVQQIFSFSFSWGEIFFPSFDSLNYDYVNHKFFSNSSGRKASISYKTCNMSEIKSESIILTFPFYRECKKWLFLDLDYLDNCIYSVR